MFKIVSLGFGNIKTVCIFVKLKHSDMTTIKNSTGSKAVKISTDSTGSVQAMYVQIYQGEEQVLDAKTYSTIKRAEKWAKSILN